jgi:hypothetical protein
MIVYKTVEREPEEKTMRHKHYPTAGMLMSRRVLDAEKDAKIHVLMWRFNVKRNQWEAVCERDDIIYISPGTDDKKDIAFRKGRYIEQ